MTPTELEWQLTRGWGAPSLEQLRRDKDQKLFTLQWEDAEHRATLEAQGAVAQPSHACSSNAITLWAFVGSGWPGVTGTDRG